MNRLKRYMIYTATLAALMGAAGCANVKDFFSKPAPTSTPSPTPTKSVDQWVTATPKLKATPTPANATATPEPTKIIYVPATPTPGVIKVTATPTTVPTTAPTSTPKANATLTPTSAPTKTPTPKPTEKPGAPTASSLMNSLYDALPDMMATTSIKVDLVQTYADGDVSNMYYTKYTNEESLGSYLHAQDDIWVTSLTKDTYSCDEIYSVINASDVTTYTNTQEGTAKWIKKKLSKDAARAGVTIVPKNSFIGLLNPVIKSTDASTGYVVEMDCAIDISDIIKTLTDGAYTKRFNKTIKATATFDHKTLQPISFNAEAENLNISTNVVLNYFQMLVDNIMDTTVDPTVPDEVVKNAR